MSTHASITLKVNMTAYNIVEVTINNNEYYKHFVHFAVQSLNLQVMGTIVAYFLTVMITTMNYEK